MKKIFQIYLLILSMLILQGCILFYYIPFPVTAIAGNPYAFTNMSFKVVSSGKIYYTTAQKKGYIYIVDSNGKLILKKLVCPHTSLNIKEVTENEKWIICVDGYARSQKNGAILIYNNNSKWKYKKILEKYYFSDSISYQNYLYAIVTEKENNKYKDIIIQYDLKTDQLKKIKKLEEGGFKLKYDKIKSKFYYLGITINKDSNLWRLYEIDLQTLKEKKKLEFKYYWIYDYNPEKLVFYSKKYDIENNVGYSNIIEHNIINGNERVILKKEGWAFNMSLDNNNNLWFLNKTNEHIEFVRVNLLDYTADVRYKIIYKNKWKRSKTKTKKYN